MNYGDYLAGHISLPIHINGCDSDGHSSGVQTYVEKLVLMELAATYIRTDVKRQPQLYFPL